MRFVIETLKFIAFTILAMIYIINLIPYAFFEYIRYGLKVLLVKLAPEQDDINKKGNY